MDKVPIFSLQPIYVHKVVKNAGNDDVYLENLVSQVGTVVLEEGVSEHIILVNNSHVAEVQIQRRERSIIHATSGYIVHI